MTTPSTPEAGVPTCYRHPGRESHIRCQRCDRPICPDCMQEASVGFQCPDCVAEGAKQTRAARTPYGGVRTGNPGLTSMVLIGLNALVFVLVRASGGADGTLINQLMLRARGLCEVGDNHFAVTQEVCSRGGTWLPGVSDGAYWQLLTSAFTHLDIWHIGFNMLALYILGPQLEMALGRVRFLALYLLSALAGSALVYWATPEFTPTLGASGAVFGLMAALMVVAVKVGGNVQPILMWIGLNFLITVVGRNFISWQGHLGGFLGGLAIAALLVWAPRGPRRTAFQASGLVAIAIVIVLAIVLRSAALA